MKNQNSYSCNVNGICIGHNYVNEESVVTIYPARIKIYSIFLEAYIVIDLKHIVFFEHHNSV